MLMFWAALLASVAANAADVPEVGKASSPVEVTVVAKTDEDGRWCAEPAFEATVTNSSVAPVWLDLGTRDSAVVVTSYSVAYWTRRRGSSQGSVSGWSDDWGSIEYLRSPHATMLKAGQSVVRPIRLEDVRLRSGRATVNVGVRIHGTQDLSDMKVRTYEPMAEQGFVLRRSGRCFEVRPLTRR
jgi:hypothetical protein